MCLCYSCVALLSFSAFYDSFTNRCFFYRDCTLFIPLYLIFLIHTLILSPHFPSLSRAFFLPHFFSSIRNPRSFIYFLLRLFSPNRPGAVRMSVKYHPCEMGCAAASFSRSSYTAISHDFALRARLTNEKLKMWDEKKSEKVELLGKTYGALKPRLFINFLNIIRSNTNLRKIFPSKFKKSKFCL